MKHRVLHAAQEEARNALDWYDTRSEGLGSEFIDELNHAYATLGTRPRSCALVEDYLGRRELSWISMRRFPYLIVFQVLATELVVVAVHHEHRKPLYWIDRVDE